MTSSGQWRYFPRHYLAWSHEFKVVTVLQVGRCVARAVLRREVVEEDVAEDVETSPVVPHWRLCARYAVACRSTAWSLPKHSGRIIPARVTAPFVRCAAHSSSGLGHRPLKAETTGSNPVCATNFVPTTWAIAASGRRERPLREPRHDPSMLSSCRLKVQPHATRLNPKDSA